MSYAARGLSSAARLLESRATELDAAAALRSTRVVSMLLAADDDAHLADRMHDLITADAIHPFASELDALWGSDAAFVEAVLRAVSTYGSSLAPESRARLAILETYARHRMEADEGAREGIDALLAGNHEMLDRHRDAWYLLARMDYASHPSRATAAMDRYVELGGELGVP
jgi:hypothetical protein